MQDRTDEQVFALLRTLLYTAVIGDILDREGVDKRDVHRSFSTTPLSASRNYSVNIPSVNAFVNAFRR
jgi:hypothetical protein